MRDRDVPLMASTGPSGKPKLAFELTRRERQAQRAERAAEKDWAQLKEGEAEWARPYVSNAHVSTAFRPYFETLLCRALILMRTPRGLNVLQGWRPSS